VKEEAKRENEKGLVRDRRKYMPREERNDGKIA
jgi:hypothetical protein